MAVLLVLFGGLVVLFPVLESIRYFKTKKNTKPTVTLYDSCSCCADHDKE